MISRAGRHLRFRLLMLILLTLIPLAGLTLYSHVEQRKQNAREAIASAQRLVELYAGTQQRLTDNTRFLLSLLAQFPQVRRRDPACRAFMANLLRGYPYYVNLAAAGPDGNVYCSATPATGPVNLADRDYFRRAVQSHHFAIGNYVFGRISKRPTVILAYPMLNESGEVLGVVLAALDLTWLNSIFSQARLPNGSTMTALDRSGTVLAHYPDPEKWVGRSVLETQVAGAILRLQNGAAEVVGIDGVRRLYAFTSLSEPEGDGGAFLSVGIPTTLVYSEADRILKRNLGMLALVMLLAAALTWIGGAFLIQRPVILLARAADRLSSGDLAARSGLPHEEWELGRLARAFDEMADALQAREAEARQAQETIRQREARLQLQIDRMPAGCIVWDQDFRVVSWNPAAERIFGLSEDEIRGRQPHGLIVPAEAQPDVDAAWRRLMEGDASADSVIENLTKDGRRIICSWSNTPLTRPDGTVLGVLSMVEDVTARKEAEKAQMAAAAAERANLAKSEFLSRISHELRTPLNSILGFAQLMDADSPRQEQRERLGYVLTAGRHLLQLINEVLDIARVESGRLHLSPEPVHIGEALDDALNLVRTLASERNVRLGEHVPEIGDVYVLADRQRLKQVFLNLLSNAIKYNRDGGTVTATCEQAPGDRLRITVSDTGHGIPQEKMDRLFAPFERIGAERTDIEGTGLGLALSKRLVEAMNGSIGVESEVGRGSTFWVELPLTEGPFERLTQVGDEELAPASRQAPVQPSTVLYIEDNLANFRLIEHIMAGRPWIKLLPAMQGGVGLDLARQHRPDIALVDLHLPDIQGDEVLRRLQADPRTRGIPVIIISADATPGEVERLLAAGASAYLTKPIDTRELLKIIDANQSSRAEAPTRSGRS